MKNNFKFEVGQKVEYVTNSGMSYIDVIADRKVDRFDRTVYLMKEDECWEQENTIKAIK